MSLRGLCVPTATLFDADGAVDPAANAEFAKGLASAGVPHLFALGSLGEFPGIDEEERPRLLRAVAEALPGSADLWAGCGAPSTRQAVRYAAAAESAGAAAVVAVPPYYLRPTEAAIARYYRAVHASTARPLLAYNIPSLVGYALRPELVHRLAEEGVLAGVKDTSGSIASVRTFLAHAPKDFAVIPGDDALATEAIAHGAAGAIMGTANVLPKLGVALVRAAQGPTPAAAQPLQRLVDRLVAIVRAGPFPATEKFLAERLRGARVGYRSPYDPLAPDEERAVLDALAPAREELARWV